MVLKLSEFVAVLGERAEKRKKQRPQYNGPQPRQVLAKELPVLEKRGMPLSQLTAWLMSLSAH